MGRDVLNSKTIILGGGLAGLSSAFFLGGNCKVLEASEVPGGLCRSFNKDGFVYDIGGHILFSKNTTLLNEITKWLGENVQQRYRRNQILYNGRYVKYPFENGLYALDKSEIYECLISFLNRQRQEPANFEEWCRFRFGEGIASKYLIPYNRKIWKRNLTEMSLHWVDRIPSPPMEDIVKSAIGIETEGYIHQLNFFYPKKGGIQALISSLTKYAPGLITKFRVSKIKKKENKWIISDGNENFSCDNVISTIPIFDLINSLENVPVKVKASLSKLQYNSLVLVMIGVKHEGLNERTALYIPDPKILPHRICFMKYFSEFNAPKGFSHLVAEITVPPNDILLSTEDDTIVEQVINDLKTSCDFSINDVVVTDVKRIKYAYVVYDSGYLENTKVVYDYLDSLGIYYTGRFGSFEYINMDTCIEMSKNLVQSFRSL